ncbi:MAG TPA: hypothetical protein VF384_19620 [Planctomycetota bacterium]
MRLVTACVLLLLTATVPAQGRIFIGAVPSNLTLNLSSTVVVPDYAAPDAFYALMPFASGAGTLGFAFLDSDPTMNLTFGTGMWTRCIMTSTHWAYLSNDSCAHQPAPGSAVPLSLLTTAYDFGFYSGRPGLPHQPWPNTTMFTGNSQSWMQGQPFGFAPENWQLRARGWNTTDLWNACPGSTSVGPTFSGWLVARFTFTFV